MIKSSRYSPSASKSERSWWRIPEGDPGLADELFVAADELRQQARGETMRDRIYEAIYNGQPLGSVERDLYGAGEIKRLADSAHADINLTQAKVDALVSRLGKKRPFPCLSTDGGSWSDRQFAEQASKAMRAKLEQTQVEREKPLVLRDALIRGTGAARVVVRGGDVCIERTPKAQILVDNIDSMLARPRTLMHAQYVQRDELIASYPDHAEAIERAGDEHDDFLPFSYSSREHVLVIEGWRKPSHSGADNGRHVVAIRGQVLLDEGYEAMRFPVALMHWVAPVTGFWGRGLVETLATIQQKLTATWRDIQEALHYGSSLTVFVPRGANINKSHLRARYPKIVETDGPTPQYVAPNPVSAQLFSFAEQLMSLMDDLSGLSRDYQSGQTSLGANASGKAMDTLYDIQSDRFAIAELAYGMFMVDLGAAIIDGAKAINASKVPRKKRASWINEIRWDRVNLDNGGHDVRLEPINFLPDTRAGKLSTVGELGKAGLVADPATMLDLINEPDLKAANRELLGPRNAISALIDIVKDEDEPIDLAYPDPHMDLAACAKRLIAEYNQARADIAPDEVLTRFRDVIAYTEDLLAQVPQGQPSAPTPLTGSPPAPIPGAPPPMDGAVPPLPPDLGMLQ